MLRVFRAVHEFQATVDDPDVVQGEEKRFPGLLLFFLRFLHQEIREVVAPVGVSQNRYGGSDKPHLVEDKGLPGHGDDLQVYEELLEGNEGPGSSPLPDAESMDGQGEGEGIEVDSLQGDLSVQGFGELLRQDRLEDRRDQEVGGNDQDSQKQNQPDGDLFDAAHRVTSRCGFCVSARDPAVTDLRHAVRSIPFGRPGPLRRWRR
jgi:hypothetical protein